MEPTSNLFQKLLLFLIHEMSLKQVIAVSIDTGILGESVLSVATVLET